MLTISSVLSGVVAAAEPIGQRATEVPELASMALLSVVLAGLSVVVRRSGPKTGDPAGDTRRRANRT